MFPFRWTLWVENVDVLDVIEVSIDRAATLALSVTPISKRVIATQFPTVESMQWPIRQLF